MLKRIAFMMFALALLIGMGVTANALADNDITGEMAYRWEGQYNGDQNSDLDDAEAMCQLRSRVNFSGDVNGNASYMLTVENYQVFGAEGSENNSIYQATFTMADFLFEDFDVTVGRMPVAYGRERMIGVEDWVLDENIVFEGLHGRYGFENGWLDCFSFKLEETFANKYVDGQGDDNLLGLYLHYDATDDFYFEPYVMLNLRENWADPDLDNDRLMVFGGLFDYVNDNLHFYGEIVIESGTTYAAEETKDIAETDLSGVGYYAGLFYDFDSPVRPFIGFEYNYASGDDASTLDKNEGFVSPYGSTSDFLGIMNVKGWADVTALRFAGGFMPVENLDVSLDFFIFTLAEEVEGEDAIGNEIDIKLDYALNEDVDLEGGFGMFSYDEASADYVEPGDSEYFAWAGARLEF